MLKIFEVLKTKPDKEQSQCNHEKMLWKSDVVIGRKKQGEYQCSKCGHIEYRDKLVRYSF